MTPSLKSSGETVCVILENVVVMLNGSGFVQLSTEVQDTWRAEQGDE